MRLQGQDLLGELGVTWVSWVLRGESGGMHEVIPTAWSSIIGVFF